MARPRAHSDTGRTQMSQLEHCTLVLNQRPATTTHLVSWLQCQRCILWRHLTLIELEVLPCTLLLAVIMLLPCDMLFRQTSTPWSSALSVDPTYPKLPHLLDLSRVFERDFADVRHPSTVKRGVFDLFKEVHAERDATVVSEGIVEDLL